MNDEECHFGDPVALFESKYHGLVYALEVLFTFSLELNLGNIKCKMVVCCWLLFYVLYLTLMHVS